MGAIREMKDLVEKEVWSIPDAGRFVGLAVLLLLLMGLVFCSVPHGKDRKSVSQQMREWEDENDIF